MDETNNQLLIYLRFDGSSFQNPTAIELPSTAKISDIRQLIKKSVFPQLNNKRFILSHGGQLLSNDALLSDCGIGSESTIDILINHDPNMPEGCHHIMYASDGVSTDRCFWIFPFYGQTGVIRLKDINSDTVHLPVRKNNTVEIYLNHRVGRDPIPVERLDWVCFVVLI